MIVSNHRKNDWLVNGCFHGKLYGITTNNRVYKRVNGDDNLFLLVDIRPILDGGSLSSSWYQQNIHSQPFS